MARLALLLVTPRRVTLSWKSPPAVMPSARRTVICVSDGKLIVEDWIEHAPTTRTGEVTLEAGRSYGLKFEYFEGRIGAVAKLVWQPPALQATGSPYAEALDVAKQADAVVLVLGLSAQLEG